MVAKSNTLLRSFEVRLEVGSHKSLQGMSARETLYVCRGHSRLIRDGRTCGFYPSCVRI
jgi:hypothetical protein